MTKAMFDKLAGIETAADVTDATNVTAAGAFMKSVDDTDDITEGTTKKFATAAEKTKLSHITVTQAVDLDTLESDTVTNNAKVSNATHTGDATGSTALTLATVNANVGSFGSATQVPTYTVNAKGLITAASNTSIAIAQSQVTGLVTDLSNKQPLDADLTTIAGLTPTTDNFMVATASAWASRTPSQARTQMGLGSLATASSVTASQISDATTAGRSMLTAADAAAQTALLDAFTSGAKGLAPASGGGTSNFLRADGTWAAPGGGSGSPGGANTNIQFNNSGAFGGSADLTWDDTLKLMDVQGGLTVSSLAILDGANSAGFDTSALTTSQTLAIPDASGTIALTSDIPTADVTGPAGATDLAIARYDGATGKLLKDSGVLISDAGEVQLAAGGTSDAPLKFQTGTNLTNPVAGAFEYDGEAFYSTTQADNRGLIPSIYFIRQDADRTLTNSTANQKIFNSVTNGALTLPTGTYLYDGMIRLSSMSATSGNADYDLLGAGTATLGTILHHFFGQDAAINTAGAVGGSYAVVASSPASAVTAATQTSLLLQIRGTFEVTSTGTIIPSLALVTAAAAVVQAGSYMKFMRLGDNSVVSVGQWS
jgi:hypothetical protein